MKSHRLLRQQDLNAIPLSTWLHELEYIYILHACLYGEHLVIFPSMCMRTCGLCCAGRATCAPTVLSKRPLAQILYEMQLAYQLFMHGFRGAAQILYE